ncbi:hypothetical protein [Metabacillus litoralis]|uniref:hypothetical protein n=1 Tax=Metabacillus litoralis TaxID=152268 RepID=UPI001CFD9743|nr:hypothetical protein [Metabacillus litoralis]
MWLKKRKETYKRKKEIRKNNSDRYTFMDGVLDIAFYVPELIFLPFRILWYFIRFIGKVFDWT